VALVTDIADAVTSELNGETFSQAFTAERKVLPEFDLADLAELQVTVVPKGVEISRADRAHGQYDVQVDIGVQKKIGSDVDAEVTDLLGLVDEIADFLCRRTLASAPWAVWLRTSNEPIYAPEHLAEKRLFTSVLTVTYRARL